jgi:hypothetical protein
MTSHVDLNRPVADAKAASGAAPAPSPYSRQNPFLAEQTRHHRLTGEGSSKDTRHFVLSLEAGGLGYAPLVPTAIPREEESLGWGWRPNRRQKPQVQTSRQGGSRSEDLMAEPLVPVRGDKGIVVQVRVGGIDTINLFTLARAESFARVETPEALE